VEKAATIGHATIVYINSAQTESLPCQEWRKYKIFTGCMRLRGKFNLINLVKTTNTNPHTLPTKSVPTDTHLIYFPPRTVAMAIKVNWGIEL
jgi:hypothetical protein